MTTPNLFSDIRDLLHQNRQRDAVAQRLDEQTGNAPLPPKYADLKQTICEAVAQGPRTPETEHDRRIEREREIAEKRREASRRIEARCRAAAARRRDAELREGAVPRNSSERRFFDLHRVRDDKALSGNSSFRTTDDDARFRGTNVPAYREKDLLSLGRHGDYPTHDDQWHGSPDERDAGESTPTRTRTTVSNPTITASPARAFWDRI
jgi:hypothetical protein